MSFVLLLVYISVLYIRPQEWADSPFYGWQAAGLGIMDYVTIAVCLAMVAKRASEGGRLMRSATDWFVLGIFGAALLSQAVHINYGTPIATFQDFGKIILLYFMVVSIVGTRRKLKVFVTLLVILTAFMALHGVLQAHRGYGFGGQPPMMHGEVMRVKAYGIFDDPNDLGLTLVVAMPVLLMWITARHGVAMRVIATGLLGLCGYALYLTNSRGGVVALAVMAFVYFYKRFGKVLSVVLGTGLLVGIMYFGPSRVQTMADDPSGAGRRDLWSAGLQLLKQRPPFNAVFGVGWNRFSDYMEHGRAAHNSYLLAVTEMGLIGLFFYLGSFYVPMRDLHRLTVARGPGDLSEKELKEFRADQSLARALIASVMGFAMASFFLSRTYNQVPYVLVAMCAVLARLAKTKPVGKPVLPDAEENRLFYDFHRPDFNRLSAGTLATVPFIYVVCRILWSM